MTGNKEKDQLMAKEEEKEQMMAKEEEKEEHEVVSGSTFLGTRTVSNMIMRIL